MRALLLVAVCVSVLGVSAYLAGKPSDEPVKIGVRLVDADTGKDVAGIVRVFVQGKDEPVALPGLFDRLRGLKPAKGARGWHVVPAKGAQTTLPRAKVRIEALSGLETALASQDVDLTDKSPREIVVKLPLIFRPEKEKLVAANTHLHLRSLSKEDADEYLRQIPAADRLGVMFISYLERKASKERKEDDDREYVTNRYKIGEPKELRAASVLFNNGEEHRHNFTPYGQGYGHVMFLDLKALVKPVSLGPGITGGGDDDRPLQTGLEEARKQGAAVLWCHNTSGYEDVPSALAGRFDALNVFDGSRGGTYEERYYRYLDVGMRLPISTGTDWFAYDFSRVYARVDGELTIKSWLAALKAGRNVATNGPLLRLSVDGKPIGDVLKLDKAATVRVEAEGVGRHAFERLQLVHNGKVVQEARSAKKDSGYAAKLTRDVKISEPGWFAVRIESKARNELDQVLFAHSSPVYVDFEGRRRFDLDAAQALQKRIEEAKAAIAASGTFSSPKAKEKLLAVYAAANDDLRARINKRGKQ
jgi:hypothetical protein